MGMASQISIADLNERPHRVRIHGAGILVRVACTYILVRTCILLRN